MCGIVGVLNSDGKPVDKSYLLQANDAMINRGPDDAGYYINGSFGMAMRRLSIIGVDNGRQPISNDDNSIHLILNGEIYNHIEIRKELQSKGYQFKTSSDAEVLVHLYQEHGMDAILQLNGMFAFALWDENKQRLWLGRDRLGIKPLVYAETAYGIAFASTLDAITLLPGVNKQIDQDSLMLYLSLSYVPTPRSIFSGIKKLAPGHWLCYENSTIKIKKYWSIQPKDKKMSDREFSGTLDDLIKDSIRLRSRSDVPVGTFLSGGIDSSSVTAYYCEDQAGGVHTFLADFEGKDSESPYADLVAKRFDTQHHKINLPSTSIRSSFEEAINCLDEPMADSAVIPSYILSKSAHEKGLKVMLSGAGGDELFGGYKRYYRAGKSRFAGKLSILSRYENISRMLNPKMYHAFSNLISQDFHFGVSTSGVHLGIMKDAFHHSKEYTHYLMLLQESLMPYRRYCMQYGYAYGGMLTDIDGYLVDNVLSIQDKTSMATSIEARVPLLDHRIVQHAFSVSPSVNLSPTFESSKKSLKNAVKNRLPNEILSREKMGFNGPVNFWIRQHMDYFLDKIRNETNSIVGDLINIDSLLHKCKSERYLSMASHTLFSLFVFNKWYRKHAK